MLSSTRVSFWGTYEALGKEIVNVVCHWYSLHALLVQFSDFVGTMEVITVGSNDITFRYQHGNMMCV